LNIQFSLLLDVPFESYVLPSDPSRPAPVVHTEEFIYRNLPKNHHVLRKVPDCIHCGALRFPYEGPAFCCRKGKVSIVTPEVPEELKRLFTSQEDVDAKYFRENIRYFNSHFSFTSLGVTLDRRVSTAARTGVYTFRITAGLYHALDNLVAADNGPRHFQLYIYDTDENLIHRANRSPDLNIELIRRIFKILSCYTSMLFKRILKLLRKSILLQEMNESCLCPSPTNSSWMLLLHSILNSIQAPTWSRSIAVSQVADIS
jgi:hypothetical protein